MTATLGTPGSLRGSRRGCAPAPQSLLEPASVPPSVKVGGAPLLILVTTDRVVLVHAARKADVCRIPHAQHLPILPKLITVLNSRVVVAIPSHWTLN